MNIFCPHTKKIVIVVLGNITCYQHEDDEDFCDLMNNFATTTHDISKTYIEFITYNHEVTPRMRVVLLSSKEARQHWYVLLSQAHGDMLKSMLRGTAQLMAVLPQMKDVIINELYSAFGNVVLSNLYEVCQRQILVPSQVIAKPVPSLPMDNLIQHDVVSVALELDARKKERERRTKEVIEALYHKKK